MVDLNVLHGYCELPLHERTNVPRQTVIVLLQGQMGEMDNDQVAGQDANRNFSSTQVVGGPNQV
jgi:hypothetical protein